MSSVGEYRRKVLAERVLHAVGVYREAHACEARPSETTRILRDAAREFMFRRHAEARRPIYRNPLPRPYKGIG